jgi:2-polyprenyl-3-methyl-5-hydroxy-6-metoxy-1,4-benzoquinol methylase
MVDNMTVGSQYSAEAAALYWGGERLFGLRRGDVAGEEAAVLGLGQHPALMRGYHDWETGAIDASIGPTPLDVLDVGCGVGRIMAHLSRDPHRLSGIDVSQEMVERSKLRMASVPNVSISQASADQLPHPPASFDVVICLGVFEHLPLPTRMSAVKEFARVLRPGGTLILELNNDRSRFLAANDADNPLRIGRQLTNGYYCELMDACEVVAAAEADGMTPVRWFFNAHYSLLRHMLSVPDETPNEASVASCVRLDLASRPGNDRIAWSVSDQLIVILQQAGCK